MDDNSSEFVSRIYQSGARVHVAPCLAANTMSDNQRQLLFGSDTLRQFRERQLQDLEARSYRTMVEHARSHGAAGAPTIGSELAETFKTIEDFATQQINKMQRMGIPAASIRTTVLSSIQQASLNLPQGSDIANAFNELKERVNNNIEQQLENRMDIRRSSFGPR